MEEESRGQMIGRRIRALREEQLFSRADFAERSGLSVQGLIKLEIGNVDQPRRKTVEKAAAALGVTPEYLMRGSEEQPGPTAPDPSASSPHITRERLLEHGIEITDHELDALNGFIRAQVFMFHTGHREVDVVINKDVDRGRVELAAAYVLTTPGFLTPEEREAMREGARARLGAG